MERVHLAEMKREQQEICHKQKANWRIFSLSDIQEKSAIKIYEFKVNVISEISCKCEKRALINQKYAIS